jgi:hypothetical protein
MNEFLLYAAKSAEAILPDPWPQYMAQSSVRGACGFVLVAKQDVTANCAICSLSYSAIPGRNPERSNRFSKFDKVLGQLRADKKSHNQGGQNPERASPVNATGDFGEASWRILAERALIDDGLGENLRLVSSGWIVAQPEAARAWEVPAHPLRRKQSRRTGGHR